MDGKSLRTTPLKHPLLRVALLPSSGDRQHAEIDSLFLILRLNERVLIKPGNSWLLD
jgi:hypothetical protein